jgi:toxin ParE1/3/4
MAHRVAPQARHDLDEIWDYIFKETGAEAAADRAIDMIVESFSLLAEWPRIGRRRDELRRGLRSYPAGNYLIFYRISRRDVVVLRVLHSRRDIPFMFRE